ncbi:O-antigen ligase family protein [Rhodoligotrophos ferricapiens]|uniref:O-antigen ligase family protein n=1 Tax=Rhodoligotrophos ferricapiens TaxID=3069264 RepID=UPI00315C5162
MDSTATVPDLPARGGEAQARRPSEAAARRFELALACAVVFLAPMNVLRVPAFYFTASDAFACLCLVIMLVNRTVQLKPFGPGTAFWMFGLTTAIAALMASSLMAGAEDRGLILLMQYLFAYFLLPLILMGRPWRQTILLMKTFVGSMVIMILHGIYVVEIVAKTNTVFVSGSGRLQGFVERENECGSLIALTVPMILCMTAMGAMRPVIALALVPLMAYGIMLTGSNTALYAMLAGVGIVFVATLTLRRLILGAAILPLLWLAVLSPSVQPYLPATFQKRVLTGLSTGDLANAGTFADRMALNEEAFRLAGDALLMGYGADQYREISAWHAPVHNLYLLMWSEGGLIALGGFVLMLTGGVVTLAACLRYRGARPVFLCGFATLSLFAMLINAVPHVYGRFWAVPVLLSLAPAVTFLKEGRTWRERKSAKAKRRHASSQAGDNPPIPAGGAASETGH